MIRHTAIGLVTAAFLIASCGRSVGEGQESQGMQESQGKQPKVTVENIKGPAGSLQVDDGGEGGIPVVFLHSFAGSSAHWKAQLAHLRPNRRAVALDFRGHGKSEAPDSLDYRVESLAGDVAAVVDGLGIKRFVLVGHSMGGAVGIAYAGAHPERVAGLLLVGTPGKVPADQADRIMTSMESDYEKVTESYWNKLLVGAQLQVLALVRSQMQSVPQDAALSIMRAIFEFDALPALSAYRGPKLEIITPHGDSPYALHKLVPGLPHKVVTGTSHWLHMDKPEEFNRILDEFLATIK